MKPNAPQESPAASSLKLPSLISSEDDKVSVDALWRRVLSDNCGPSATGSLEAPGLQREPKFVHIDDMGRASMVTLDRHELVHSLRLRYRDMVVVDPTIPLQVASVVLVRTRALVVNLDVGGALRMVICENQCYVLSVPKASDPGITALPTLDHPFIERLSTCLKKHAPSQQTLGAGGTRPGTSFDADMPYELRALEVALSACLGILGMEVSALEETAHPAIEAMLHKVERTTLEAIRWVKNSIDKLQAKVARAHQELRELLEDDADMADMYLGRRAEALGLPPLPQPWEDPLSSDDDIPKNDGNDAHDGEGNNIDVEWQIGGRRGHLRATEGAAGQDPQPVHSGRRLGPRHHRRDSREDVGATGPSRRGGRQARRRSRYAPDRSTGLRREEGRAATDSHSSVSYLSDAEHASMASEEADAALDDAEEALMEDDARSDSGAWRAYGVDPHDIEEAEDLLEAMFVKADLLARRLRILDEVSGIGMCEEWCIATIKRIILGCLWQGRVANLWFVFPEQNMSRAKE